MNKSMMKAGLALAVAVSVTAAASAGVVEQTGSLSGGKGTTMQTIVLDQFDDAGGTLVLDSITIDLLVSTIGGYETDGSGQAVDIFSNLTAEISFDGMTIVSGDALIMNTVANTNSIAASVFDTDTDQAILTTGDIFDAFLGSGTISLDGVTTFAVSEDPAGIINFGAGGTINYTVTYDFSVVPAPSAALLMMVGSGLAGVRRRRD